MRKLLLASALSFVLIFLFFVINKPLLYSMSLNANEDALSHVLVTCKILKNEHNTFPTVFTYPGSHNHGINNLPTSSVPDNQGKFYYTSFPPGMFMIPHIFYKLSGVEINPASLRLFSFTLLILTSLLFGKLSYELLDSRIEINTRVASSIIIGILSFTMFESMKSYTLSFWGQHLLQPLLLLGSLIVFKNKWNWILIILVIISPWIEWTGMVFSAGLCGVVFFRWILQKKILDLYFSIVLLFAFISSVFVMVNYIGKAISISEYFDALRYRGDSRSFAWKMIPMWIVGMLLSLGPLALLMLMPATMKNTYLYVKGILQDGNSEKTALALSIFVLFFPLIENAICLNHAVLYSYDRHKVCLFLLLIFSLACVKKHGALNLKKAAIVSALGVLMYGSYIWVLHNFRAERGRKYEIVGNLVREMSLDELPLLNEGVRGNYLYYAGRNIAETNNHINDKKNIRLELKNFCHQLGYNKARLFGVNGEIIVYQIDYQGNDVMFHYGYWK